MIFQNKSINLKARHVGIRTSTNSKYSSGIRGTVDDNKWLDENKNGESEKEIEFSRKSRELLFLFFLFLITNFDSICFCHTDF